MSWTTTPRRKVDSSMFFAMTYDPVQRTLELEQHDGVVCRYLDVPESIADKMHRATSRGKFYHSWVHGLFEREVLQGTAGRLYMACARTSEI